MPVCKVAVVILNWNGKQLLETFLPSVLQYSSKATIVVADNASADDSVLFLNQKFPSVVIVQNTENGGFAKGYNDALKKVDAAYYILLNSDVEVTENWIEPIISLMDADNTIAACQPKILAYNEKNKFEYAGACGGFIDKYGYPFCRGRIFNSLEEDQGQYNNNMEILWATGACMFVRSKVFHQLNGFDEDYFAHMEEIDLCWRMKNIGYKIYVVPQSRVYHLGGGTLNKLSPRKTYLNFRNNLITYTKNHADRYLFIKVIFRLKLDGIAAFKFLFEGSPKHFLAVIRAHFAYYALLPSTLAKRKKLKNTTGYKPATTGILNHNIVVLHYFKNTDRFSQIKF